ncbi:MULTISPECIES: hypothetical protein [unclassified Nodularia (in: cyanobacteria)]|nr:MULTISPECIES: hypothetical protein [unclassified Nodularia (in: cyanobacteria)]MBE9201514.1 hypothetical protein [Nodularia sp. LEGE 06071]MCC2694417.1 hypothetical protein [Nodularia sp. LEGE 04288]
MSKKSLILSKTLLYDFKRSPSAIQDSAVSTGGDISAINYVFRVATFP